MDEHLRVAARREAVSARGEVVAQLAVVVDLAVLHEVDAAVLVSHRLVAVLEVDDREPPGADPGLPVDHQPGAVGAAVGQRPGHPVEDVGIGPYGRIGRGDAADAAHAASLGGGPARDRPRYSSSGSSAVPVSSARICPPERESTWRTVAATTDR